MKPKETIERFDLFLETRGLSLDAVVIGGTALVLLEVVSRQTRDCDILDPQIPADVADAAREFALDVRNGGEPLDDEWLNNGPSSLADVLPEGWNARVLQVFTGKALTLHSLGRTDLLMSKLFALCDRGIDLKDCVALSPTAEELDTILPWLIRQDLHPGWSDHARSIMADLAKRLGHGV
jgi:hypothetical protein